MMVRAR